MLGWPPILRTFRRKIASRKDRQIIERSGLFNESWYRKNYSDIGERSFSAIRHYVDFGRFEGKNPSADFDTNFYLRENPDVLNAGINPLVHFIEHGKSEGRQPVPWRMDPDASARHAPKPIMTLGPVRSEGGRSTINFGDGELWVEARIRGGQHLELTPSIEAFLPMLMLIAAERDVPVEINADLEDAYFASLKYGFAPFIRSLYGKQPPTIIRRGSNSPKTLPELGASGLLFSAGVDSFYSLVQIGHELKPDFLINIHAGAHDDNRLTWHFRLENIAAISSQLDIPIIEVDTNFHLHYPKAHVHCATIRNIAACLALSPKVTTFYYSSAIAYEDISFKTAREHGIHFIDHAAIANILPPGIRAIELGYDASRTQKTKRIANNSLANKHLDVCTNQPYQAGKVASMPINCGRCAKCIRTIATLDHLGELNKFSGVFDLDMWNASKEKSLKILESSHEPLDQDVLEYFKSASN